MHSMSNRNKDVWSEKLDYTQLKAEGLQRSAGQDISGAVIYTIADVLKLRVFNRQNISALILQAEHSQNTWMMCQPR